MKWTTLLLACTMIEATPAVGTLACTTIEAIPVVGAWSTIVTCARVGLSASIHLPVILLQPLYPLLQTPSIASALLHTLSVASVKYE
jgi:hypothetical protein